MTPQEAIENINNILDSDYLCDESIDYQLTTDDIECLEMSKEALEKQIPKKPLDKSLEYDGYYGRCPCCNKVVGESKDFSRCWYCGQALDWSDTE